MEYLSYEDLHAIIMKFISTELVRQNTQVVLIPSARDINHIYPLPQPAYPEVSDKIHRLGNPQTFKINDITVSALNAEIVKELCLSTVVKDVKDAKIDVALRSIIEQRTYYPVYPNNPSSPIEWTQYKKMMFPHGMTPDILIVPSDLMLFAKVTNHC